MPSAHCDRSLSRVGGCLALALWLILNTAAGETASTTVADPVPFVLTARGNPVRASSPAGVEVTLGAERVLPPGEPGRLD